MWAEREVQHMSTDVIREFEIVLDQENPDMFKWLTTQVGCWAA
jgi:succinate dehydrogenase flavin-adding protein (antitoxin of CptAB toxin-antitoxin module)